MFRDGSNCCTIHSGSYPSLAGSSVKLFLSGPMKGIEDYNYPAFNEAAKKLRAIGHTVYNPAEYANGKQKESIRYYLACSCNDILWNSEAIVMLPGWENSKGAKAEKALAESLGLRVWCYKDDGEYASYRGGYCIFPIKEAKEVSSAVDEAKQIVTGSRNEAYGNAEDNFKNIGLAWGGILGTDAIPPEKVALMMTGMKLVREGWKPQRDNIVDAHGYLLCLERIKEQHGDI